MDNEMLTSELKGQRTLATVVFTDCVGFSARMSVNEEHTLDLIRRDLKLMKKVCERFEGRVLKTTGDGLLMCFSSAVKAVECAIEIQRAIAEAIATLPPSDALLHRIGIHLADMYITETDVMGNGVNIAARLQTEADPGGICISQTVYDVAKHGLQLVTEYLGPRDLKNIREVVPAYKVLLDQEFFESDPYLEAARHLEQSPNLSRIRKLMFYVCKHRWESDETKLMRLHLRGIVQEFLGMASSYEQLRGLLNSAVGNLSKQVEYSLVANEILSAVASFYMGGKPLPIGATVQPGHSAIASARSSTPATLEQQQLYRQIAQKLDQHSDALRIKKLLYYICKRTWASDLAQLNGINTENLVQTVHGLAPDGEQLRQLIDKFVQTLNKRAEYSLVAVTLMGQVGALYGEPLSEVNTAVPTAAASNVSFNSSVVAAVPPHLSEKASVYHAIAARLEQDPQILRIKKLLIFVCKSQWTSDPTQIASFSTVILVEELHTLAPTFEQLQQSLSALVKSLSKQAEYQAIANLLMQKLRPLYQVTSAPRPAATQLASPAPAATPPASPQPEPPTDPTDAGSESRLEADIDKLSQSDRQPINLFDVRLAIQKYTNPLRAKILAFSALHSEFHFNEQDWFNLKMYELDTLLRGLLKACRSYTDLEHLLYSTARRLRDPEDLIQAADTVTKFLRIFYVHGSPSLLISLPPDETKISLDDFEEATRGFANLDDEFDHTCQLVSPSSGLNTIMNQPADSGSSTCLIPTAEQDPVSGG